MMKIALLKKMKKATRKSKAFQSRDIKVLVR